MLLALVDRNYNFTCIDIGSYGSQSDAGIFAKSKLMKAIETKQLKIPENSMIVGDDTFPLKTYLMKPYPRGFQQMEREKFITIVGAPRERYWAATKIRPFLRIPTTIPSRMLAAVNARRRR